MIQSLVVMAEVVVATIYLLVVSEYQRSFSSMGNMKFSLLSSDFFQTQPLPVENVILGKKFTKLAFNITLAGLLIAI